MNCINCNRTYFIIDSIPRMYISDDEIISNSKNIAFSKFIINRENIDNRIINSKIRFKSSFFISKILTTLFISLGWISFLSCISLLFFSSYLNYPVLMIFDIPLYIYLLTFALLFFIIDYLRYRTKAKINYLNNLQILTKLFNQQKLSEHDIRFLIKDEDKRASYTNEFRRQKEYTKYKGKKIASLLHNINGKTALNVGCGGKLHKLTSKPYFDQGYDMIGVDISEEYLKEFTQTFDTDGISANAMALPFKNNHFDLVNFTDIIEHLHHPFLGLTEAQRVLKKNGIIILTTENRCYFSWQCINPLIFTEKIISLYYDNILPPRDILGQWMGFNFYHTEFSKNEIIELLNVSGFEILSLETQFLFRARVLTKIFEKIPILKYMCNEFIIVGKKQL